MKAVILAGGLGTRLKPFTEVIPKPLLPIGEKSILEIQIQNLIRYGFHEIFIATNYMAEYVESFIGNGEKIGARIKFSREEEPLGTCGPLTLLKEDLIEPFIVMNGDILSRIDFKKLYDFGISNDCDLTVATKEIRTPYNFGCIKSENNLITKMDEKPDMVMEILAGIYFMRPSIFKYIPENKLFGMDHLINKLLDHSIPISRYLMNEYWLDIGRIDDFNEAQQAYKKHFKE